MDNLREAFEDVADCCEKILEARRGRAIGMTLGALIRTIGRIAMLPPDLALDEGRAVEGRINARADVLLKELATRTLATSAYDTQPRILYEPSTIRTNMTYDTGLQPRIAPKLRRLDPWECSMEGGGGTMPSSRPEIYCEEMDGWLRVSASPGVSEDTLEPILAEALAQWISDRPHLHVWRTAPVRQHGRTTELHAWYDRY